LARRSTAGVLAARGSLDGVNPVASQNA